MFIFKDTLKRGPAYPESTPYTAPDGTRHDRTPRELLTEIADPLPPADYSEDTHYRTEQDEAPYVVYTRKSDEQIAAAALSRTKGARMAAIDGIKVTTASGKVFDGDEVSQGRMARAIIALSAAGGTVSWVLANNTVAQVNATELTEALALAGAEQARLWVTPYV